MFNLLNIIVDFIFVLGILIPLIYMIKSGKWKSNYLG